MCGGIVGVLCAGLAPHARRSTARRLQLILGYNAGRIASYAVGGALAGGVGAIAVAQAPVFVGQLVLKALAAALMLGIGLHLAGIWPSFARLERLGLPVWTRIQPLARRLLPIRSTGAAVGLGLVWGWLPCGLVYSALTLALASGSAPAGAMTMLAFGLGTLPVLLLMGIATEGLADFVRRARVRLAIGLAMASFGAFGLVAVVASSAHLDRSVSAEQHMRAHCH
jgi:sulfite exporter TauE/SafE